MSHCATEALWLKIQGKSQDCQLVCQICSKLLLNRQADHIKLPDIGNLMCPCSYVQMLGRRVHVTDTDSRYLKKQGCCLCLNCFRVTFYHCLRMMLYSLPNVGVGPIWPSRVIHEPFSHCTLNVADCLNSIHSTSYIIIFLLTGCE